jgi:hypothetical protein
MVLDNNIMSVVIVMLISSLIGLTIVKTIDSHMSDISINMPAINLPQQKITVQVTDHNMSLPAPGLGSASKTSSGVVIPSSTVKSGNIIYNSLDSLQKGGGPAPICSQKLAVSPAESRSIYKPSKYRSLSKAIKSPSITVPDPSTDHSSRPAPYPRKESAMNEPQPAPLPSPTYYKHPNDMTASQLVKFQEKAKFTNMNVKDYENWLQTFVQTPEKLVGFHRANLKVLVRGGTLEQTDMPVRTVCPDTAKDQYSKIMDYNLQDNVPQPEFLGYKPSNFENQIGFPADKNRNMRHLDYINPDEPLKTWILTRETTKMSH